MHSRHLHEGILELAERITELHGERLESVVFLCTGTEANEMALRMARAATGWRGIVCSGAAYHGTSAVVGKLTHVHPRTPERGTEVRGFPFPQTHRPLAGGPIDEPIVFLCTGTEANEMALRMARAATGWRGIVCSGAAYHGTSAVVGKLTHVHPRTPERGTEVRGFPFPQTHRPLAGGPIDEPIEELRARYLDRLPAAIDDLTNDGVGFAGSVCPIFAITGGKLGSARR